jgi:predicted transcriptional regulator
MTNLNYIQQKPITIKKNSSIQQAIIGLLEKNISRVIIMDCQSPIGIITEKDIGIFLLNDESEKSLDCIPVSDIMKPFISVDRLTSIQEGAQIMIDREIGSLGITSRDSTLTGIVTKTDLVKHYKQNYIGQNKVGDLMTISYVSMNSNELLYKIVSKMVKEKISRIFLKNKDNELEGILTFRDLFQLAIEKGHLNTLSYNSYPKTSVLHMGEGFGYTTLAKDIMNKNVFSVDFDDDLVMACAEMVERRINGVGVKIMDKISGVISKTDVIKAMSKIDDEFSKNNEMTNFSTLTQ